MWGTKGHSINPNHPKSSKIFWKNAALLETGTFTSSNGAKLLQVTSAEYERSTKMHGAF